MLEAEGSFLSEAFVTTAPDTGKQAAVLVHVSYYGKDYKRAYLQVVDNNTGVTTLDTIINTIDGLIHMYDIQARPILAESSRPTYRRAPSSHMCQPNLLAPSFPQLFAPHLNTYSPSQPPAHSRKKDLQEKDLRISACPPPP